MNKKTEFTLKIAPINTKKTNSMKCLIKILYLGMSHEISKTENFGTR